MKFDKQTCIQLRQEINEALDKIAGKHGIHINAGNASYDEAHIKFSLQVTHIDPTGMSSPEALAYRQYARAFGYNPDLLGKEVVFAGKKYRILGLLARGEKYPILAAKDGGKLVKLMDTCVKLPEVPVAAAVPTVTVV